MAFNQRIKNFIFSDWFAAFLLLVIFYSANGYRYGWDDQHLEIPLLKKLIDPSLYVGDYYVESLKNNFTSFFYPILAKIITIDQIPAAYFILYLISRYVLFFWSYKIWQIFTNNKANAFMAVMVFIVMGRVDEFLYRTFSHQEFALAIIVGGIYYFFKDRILLASILLGIAANFHALYSLFPYSYIFVYLVLTIKEKGWKPLITSVAAFGILSLPFLIWNIQKYSHAATASDPSIYKNWLDLYFIACPQNFFLMDIPAKVIFTNILALYDYCQMYLIAIALFVLNNSFNPVFKNNLKAKVYCWTGFGFLLFCLLFTNVFPNKFVADLNLVRHNQYLLFLLMGFTTLFIINIVEKERLSIAYYFAILFILIKLGEMVTFYSLFLMVLILLIKRSWETRERLFSKLWLVVAAVFVPVCFYWLNYFLSRVQFRFITIMDFFLLVLTLSGLAFYLHFQEAKKEKPWARRLFVTIPLLVFFLQFSYYHFEQFSTQNQGDGYWRVQRNWEDMQRFVRDNTPKNAIILTPYDMEMGGFRILSERSVVVCYRDCGIIGFDYKAAQNWYQRIQDVEEYKVALQKSFRNSIQNAIIKYKADYIVFMRYAKPKDKNELMELVYTNGDFCLFKVTAQLE